MVFTSKRYANAHFQDIDSTTLATPPKVIKRQDLIGNNDFEAFNMGLHVGDDNTKVRDTRAALNDMLKKSNPLAKMVWVNQVHGTQVLTINSYEQGYAYAASNNIVDADAIYTTSHDVGCCIMTADCLPIVICSLDGKEIAAVHAGWRGLLDGVIESTLAKFSSPIEQLQVWIGPSICAAHFEVDSDLAAQFKDYPDSVCASTISDSKSHIDLALVAKLRMQNLGVTNVSVCNKCTYCNPQDYFSHRRSSHLGQNNCGRMVTVVMKK